MYLSSLILHFFLLLLLLFSPDLLRRGRMMIGIPVEVAPQKRSTPSFCCRPKFYGGCGNRPRRTRRFPTETGVLRAIRR